jgi:hypothetical protein
MRRVYKEHEIEDYRGMFHNWAECEKSRYENSISNPLYKGIHIRKPETVEDMNTRLDVGLKLIKWPFGEDEIGNRGWLPRGEKGRLLHIMDFNPLENPGNALCWLSLCGYEFIINFLLDPNRYSITILTGVPAKGEHENFARAAMQAMAKALELIESGHANPQRKAEVEAS